MCLLWRRECFLILKNVWRGTFGKGDVFLILKIKIVWRDTFGKGDVFLILKIKNVLRGTFGKGEGKVTISSTPLPSTSLNKLASEERYSVFFVIHTFQIEGK